MHQPAAGVASGAAQVGRDRRLGTRLRGHHPRLLGLLRSAVRDPPANRLMATLRLVAGGAVVLVFLMAVAWHGRPHPRPLAYASVLPTARNSSVLDRSLGAHTVTRRRRRLACSSPGGAGEDEHYLTTSEAAALLGFSPRTVIRWANRGLLPSTRTADGQLRFRKADVEGIGVGLRGPEDREAGE